MRRILSTGDPEKDAKLVSEALGPSNPRTREEDDERMRAANEAQITENRNALVDTPHNEGEILLVLPDEEETHDDETKKPLGSGKVVTSPAAPAVVQQTVSTPPTTAFTGEKKNQ